MLNEVLTTKQYNGLKQQENSLIQQLNRIQILPRHNHPYNRLYAHILSVMDHSGYSSFAVHFALITKIGFKHFYADRFIRCINHLYDRKGSKISKQFTCDVDFTKPHHAAELLKKAHSGRIITAKDIQMLAAYAVMYIRYIQQHSKISKRNSKVYLSRPEIVNFKPFFKQAKQKINQAAYDDQDRQQIFQSIIQNKLKQGRRNSR